VKEFEGFESAFKRNNEKKRGILLGNYKEGEFVWCLAEYV